MTRLVRPSVGLLGRVLAILLLTLLIEFGASTLLYERASQFAVRDDEARRLAEHLVISRKLVAERPSAERPGMAGELTTDRYVVRWEAQRPRLPPISPALDGMRGQILAWEPSLANSDLRLQLSSPGRRHVVVGSLRLPDASWLYFRTREPLTSLNLSAERVALALIPAIALMVLGGMLIRRTLLPLRHLADAADRVGGDDAAPVREEGTGEVRRVVQAFNRMQNRIKALIADRTQALAAVGHDLRTPLARLRLRTEAIEADGTRDAIAHDIAEMEAMIDSLLAFLGGDADPEAPSRTDLAVLCATLADDAADRGYDAEYRGPDHCEVNVRRLGVKRALSNLVDNALHHATRIAITLESRSDAVVVAVEDDGPGIPDDMLERVTEPFVRLDAARARDTIGFGLGLPIVAQAAAREGGALRLTNLAPHGLRAELLLPNHSDTK